MYSFKMRTTVIEEKMLYVRIFGGLSVSMLGLSLMFVFFHKSWFLSWSRLRTPVFLKLDRCTLTAVM